jgi:hypothetical protein
MISTKHEEIFLYINKPVMSRKIMKQGVPHEMPLVYTWCPQLASTHTPLSVKKEIATSTQDRVVDR